MNFVVEFYKGLDTVNLIIFWGVIIVVILLLVFAIIITNKNRKLERIIEENGIDIDNYDDELAIKKETNIKITKEENINSNTYNKEEILTKPAISNVEIINQEQKSRKEFTPLIIKEEVKNDNEIETIKMPVMEENKEDKFIAEEHVMEYHNDAPKLANIENKIIPEITETRTPYEHNVLREISSNQTSPIGIAVRHTNSEKEIARARELHAILNEKKNTNNAVNNSVGDEYLINQKRYANTYKEPTRKGDYLEELSKKLSNATASNDINRTEYELKQEEDAIISYQELLQKKDSIKTIDEEEAIISIDELRSKKANEEKIYNLTKEEENDDFIKELKHFRSDL